MKSKTLVALLILFLSMGNIDKIYGQDTAGPVHSYLANYYSILNNLGDSDFKISEKKLFAAELMDLFFLRGKSLVFNDLNPDGTVLLKADEYLDNIALNHQENLSFDYEIIKVGELDISKTPMKMTCTVAQTISAKRKKDIITELDFVIEIYNLSNDGSLYGRIKSIDMNEAAKERRLSETKDTDGDGVLDKNDECPEAKGSAKFRGCPDTDLDGLADHLDDCPKIKGIAKYNGCPIPDTDADGFNDEQDECPSLAGNLRGCPDSDGDGFQDRNDNCPNVKGSDLGCPKQKTNEEIASSVVDNKTEKEQIPTQEKPLENNQTKKATENQIRAKNNQAKKFLVGVSYGNYAEKGGLGVNNNRVYDPNTISIKLGFMVSQRIGIYVQPGWNFNLGNHLNLAGGILISASNSIDIGIGYLNKKTFAFDSDRNTDYSARAGGPQIELGYYINNVRISAGINYLLNSAIGTVETAHTGFEIGCGYRF